MNIKSFTH